MKIMSEQSQQPQLPPPQTSTSSSVINVSSSNNNISDLSSSSSNLNAATHSSTTLSASSTTVAAAAAATRFTYPNEKSKYILQEIIGAGATAQVHAALCTENNERVAIKRINLEKFNTSMEELFKEIQVMSQCHHENVVTYYTSFVVEEELWLVLRLLDGGSLLDILKFRMKTMNIKHGVLDEISIATVLREVLKGLEYFHANGHIHRDIKAGNILLGLDGSIQIADFGVSAFISSGGDMTRDKVKHTFVGTPCWMAPEVMEQKPTGYDTKADIWSLGITAIELATGTAPYHKYPPMKVLMMTLQNEPPTLDFCAEEKDQYKNYSKAFRKMIGECLKKDPAERPTAKMLLKHDFFKRAKDKGYIAKQLALPADARNMKVKTRLPVPAIATSGRWSKKADGEWVFDFDEPANKSDCSDEDVENNPAAALQLAASNGKLNVDTDEEDNDADATVHSDSNQQSNLAAKLASNRINTPNNPPLPSSSDLTVNSSNNQQTTTAAASTTTTTASLASSSTTTTTATATATSTTTTTDNKQNANNNNPIHLVLRMRDEKRELQDIKFDFLPKDTVDEISHELVNAQLIDAIDMIAVSSNLSKLLENNSLSPITFPLKSSVGPNEVPDEKSLVGYAQLSIGDK